MAWDNIDHYFSGQGVVLLAARGPNGAPLGFYPVGNVSDLKITVAVSTLEHKESKSGQRATDLRLTTETKVGISFTGENFDSANLARVQRGATTKREAGSVVDVPAVGFSGGITPLDHIKVSDLVLKVDIVTPVTLTPFDELAPTDPWDYKWNADAGSFILNDDDATRDALDPVHLTDGAVSLLASYDYEAHSVVDTLTQGEEEVFLRFEGLNTAESNAPVVVEVFRIRSDPLKELALISDTVQQFVMEGSALSDATRSSGSKFYRVLHLN